MNEKTDKPEKEGTIDRDNFPLSRIREIDISRLTERGLSYVRTSRAKGVLELEGHIKNEPLDLFRETLELLVDG